MKYTETEVVFKEVPDEITLAINISGCPCRCPGCHSPHLWEDVGYDLTERSLKNLIETNKGISCVSFMGGDANPEEVSKLAKFVKTNFPSLKTSWYSGRSSLSDKIRLGDFNYIKIGPYIEERGGLENPNTNQVFYKVNLDNSLEDITYRFKKRF